MALASMILGIVSIVLFCVWYLAIPAAVLAIILGFVAKSKMVPGQSGSGQATAGIVCGFIALLLAIVIVAGFISLLHFGVPALQKQLQQMQQYQQQNQQQNTPTTSPTGLFHLPRLLIDALRYRFV